MEGGGGRKFQQKLGRSLSGSRIPWLVGGSRTKKKMFAILHNILELKKCREVGITKEVVKDTKGRVWEVWKVWKVWGPLSLSPPPPPPPIHIFEWKWQGNKGCKMQSDIWTPSLLPPHFWDGRLQKGVACLGPLPSATHIFGMEKAGKGYKRNSDIWTPSYSTHPLNVFGMKGTKGSLTFGPSFSFPSFLVCWGTRVSGKFGLLCSHPPHFYFT